MTECKNLYPTYPKNLARFFGESQLTMPELLIMASILLPAGGGLTREELINYTQWYKQQLNIPACGTPKCKWNPWKATDEELSDAIDALETKRYIFLCSEKDIELLHAFFSWNGIEYVENFPIYLGRYYVTYLGHTIQRKIDELYYKNDVIQPETWRYWSLDFQHNLMLSDFREGIETALKKHGESPDNNEIFSIGPWTKNIWEVSFHGFATRMSTQEDDCPDDLNDTANTCCSCPSPIPLPQNEASPTPTDEN